MRSSLAALAAFATIASAHFNFEALIVNDEVTEPYQYVRQTTNANSPVTDVTSNDLICNQGGLDADIMAKTETYTVQAGDSVGFTINSEIGHPGPLHVYMSKATGTAKEYDGSGEWFKVYALTTSSITADGLQWGVYENSVGINNFTFQLPADLAAGDYLMRAEHISIHGAQSAGGAQFYLGCAQLTVEGSGSATPTETVSIPGLYDGTEPGIQINIYYPVPTEYTDPGPATWPNSCEDSSVNFAGQTSDGDCGSASTSGSGSSSSGSGTSSSGSGSGSSTPTATGSGSTPTATGSASSGKNDAAADDNTDDGSDDACTKKVKRSEHKKRQGMNMMKRYE